MLELTLGVLRIRDTQENVITFISLYVLEVLYKEGFTSSSVEERLDRWILLSAKLQFVSDRYLLPQIERSDPERDVGISLCVFDNSVSHFTGFSPVQSRTLIKTVRNELES